VNGCIAPSFLPSALKYLTASSPNYFLFIIDDMGASKLLSLILTKFSFGVIRKVRICCVGRAEGFCLTGLHRPTA
jgi:hypothetical protein